MSNEDLDEEYEELNREIPDYKEYSRISLYAGVLGLAVSVANCYFLGEPNLETSYKSYAQMNNAELIPNAIFAVSSVLFFGGEAMYWVINFIEEDFKIKLRKENENKLEKKLKD
jgi:hypothetical protein